MWKRRNATVPRPLRGAPVLMLLAVLGASLCLLFIAPIAHATVVGASAFGGNNDDGTWPALVHATSTAAATQNEGLESQEVLEHSRRVLLSGRYILRSDCDRSQQSCNSNGRCWSASKYSSSTGCGSDRTGNIYATMDDCYWTGCTWGGCPQGYKEVDTWWCVFAVNEKCCRQVTTYECHRWLSCDWVEDPKSPPPPPPPPPPSPPPPPPPAAGQRQQSGAAASPPPPPSSQTRATKDMPAVVRQYCSGTVTANLVSVAESACRDQTDYFNCASSYTMALSASGSACGLTLTPTRSSSGALVCARGQGSLTPTSDTNGVSLSGSFPGSDPPIAFAATSLSSNRLTLRLDVPGLGACTATYSLGSHPLLNEVQEQLSTIAAPPPPPPPRADVGRAIAQNCGGSTSVTLANVVERACMVQTDYFNCASSYTMAFSASAGSCSFLLTPTTSSSGGLSCAQGSGFISAVGDASVSLRGSFPDSDPPIAFSATSLSGNSLALQLDVQGLGTCTVAYTLGSHPMLTEVQRQLEYASVGGGSGAAGAALVPRLLWLTVAAAAAQALRRLI